MLYLFYIDTEGSSKHFLGKHVHLQLQSDQHDNSWIVTNLQLDKSHIDIMGI